MTTPTGLLWTVKSSFLRYVATMADGRCSVTDGADVVPSDDGGPGRFRFALDGVETEGSVVTARFRGDVRFSGHHGMLFVRIADPVLAFDDSGRGQLSVTDAEGTERLPLVELTLNAAGDGRWHGTEARLTEAGSDMFGGVYPEHEPFDDLTLDLPAHPRPSPEPPPPPAGVRPVTTPSKESNR
ncbi:HtaA domain-containing protein [Streptomyces sp. NPDC057074]|uniref:HtaA domain-containing protein n=1 Tax=Streptomyces sp. NPDC057074 TaxID=3346015 RepID=UPI0036431999